MPGRRPSSTPPPHSPACRTAPITRSPSTQSRRPMARRWLAPSVQRRPPGRPPALSAMSATASGTTVTWGFGVSDDVIGDAVCTVNASGNPVRAEAACGSMLSGSFNGAYSTAYTVTARCPDGARHVRRAGEGRPPACRHCARRPACMAGCWIVDGPSRVRPTRGPPPGLAREWVGLDVLRSDPTWCIRP